MNSMQSFIARANIVRMRLQLASPLDAATHATIEQLLKTQLEILRAAESEEGRKQD